MIVSFFTYNEKTENTIFRSFYNLDKSIINHLLKEFKTLQKEQSGSLKQKLYSFHYSKQNENFLVLVTNRLFSKINAINLLKTISESANLEDFADVLCVVDECINKDTFFILNDDMLNTIKSMDSQEEKIHEMMVMNKELEVIEKQKEMKMKTSELSEIDIQLERVRNLELEIRNESIQQIKSITEPKNIKSILKEKRTAVSSYDEPITIIIKEKLKLIIDKENNIKSSEIQGDMSLLVKEEDYENIEVHFDSGDKEILKFSPNLDKNLTKKNILKGTKKLPVNKNVALIKWKTEKKKFLPISFTFWPSEIEMDRFQITFEYTTDIKDMKGLTIFFSKDKLSEISFDDKNMTIKDNYIEWTPAENLTTDSVEFSCSCSDPSDIFPVEVFFTNNSTVEDIEVVKITKDEEEIKNYGISRLFEVDKFTIVNE